jgi:poly-gamma-glutamate synthesis protein (capsule biosynthesis protein)
MMIPAHPACLTMLALQIVACASSVKTVERPLPRGRVKVTFVGDVMVGRSFNALLDDDAQYRVARGFGPEDGEEVFCFNLETTITGSEDLWVGKEFNFKLDPRHAEAALTTLPVADRAVRVASLANNHALDFGFAGLDETIATLDALDVRHVGAGGHIEAARAPTVVTTRSGVRVGFLAASSHCSCPEGSWDATESTPGIWQFAPDSWSELVAGAEELRTEVDWLVVSLHWGPNYSEDWPIDWMQTLARELSAAGVDVIHGHSSHHVLPVEQWKNTLVLNGTGDFLDDYAPVEHSRNDLSFLARVHLQPSEIPELEVVPLRLEHGAEHFVHPLEEGDPDYQRVLEDAGMAP